MIRQLFAITLLSLLSEACFAQKSDSQSDNPKPPAPAERKNSFKDIPADAPLPPGAAYRLGDHRFRSVVPSPFFPKRIALLSPDCSMGL